MRALAASGNMVCASLSASLCGRTHTFVCRFRSNGMCVHARLWVRSWLTNHQRVRVLNLTPPARHASARGRMHIKRAHSIRVQFHAWAVVAPGRRSVGRANFYTCSCRDTRPLVRFVIIKSALEHARIHRGHRGRVFAQPRGRVLLPPHILYI